METWFRSRRIRTEGAFTFESLGGRCWPRRWAGYRSIRHGSSDPGDKAGGDRLTFLAARFCAIPADSRFLTSLVLRSMTRSRPRLGRMSTSGDYRIQRKHLASLRRPRQVIVRKQDAWFSRIVPTRELLRARRSCGPCKRSGSATAGHVRAGQLWSVLIVRRHRGGSPWSCGIRDW